MHIADLIDMNHTYLSAPLFLHCCNRPGILIHRLYACLHRPAMTTKHGCVLHQGLSWLAGKAPSWSSSSEVFRGLHKASFFISGRRPLPPPRPFAVAGSMKRPSSYPLDSCYGHRGVLLLLLGCHTYQPSRYMRARRGWFVPNPAAPHLDSMN
jgi:hypothetical protein